MFIAIIPLVLLIVGLLMYVLSANPKIAEVGRMTFFAGILAFAFATAKTVLHLP